MYIPPHNAETDPDLLRRLVRDNAFGTLVVPRGDGEVELAHLPFVLDEAPEGARLRVHTARANRIWRDALAADRPGEIVVVFHGPHGYVSPTWYGDPERDVPTWNYAVVHAHVATPTEMNEADVLGLLDDLARAHETSAAPWRLADHPTESRDRLVRAIVGLHLPVVRWEAKLKLSQNRTDDDHARVVAALESRGTENDRAMASMMRARVGSRP